MFRHVFTYSYFGLFGTVAHYLLMGLMMQTGVNASVSTTGGAILGASVNYILFRRFVFLANAGKLSTDKLSTAAMQLMRFGLVATVCIITNCVVFAVSHRWLYTVPSQIFATATALIVGYTGNRYWTFKPSGVTTSDNDCKSF